MSVPNGIDRMFGLSRRQEIVARIVELLKERFPQVVAATISAPSNACDKGHIPLTILLREPVAETIALSTEIRHQLEQVTGFAVSLVLLEAAGSPEAAGLLRRGRLILDRDPRFRADYTWTAGSGYPESLTVSGRRSVCAAGQSG